MATDVDITVFDARINTMLSGASGPVASRLRRSGVRVQNRAKQLCPVDTGRLRSSIQLVDPHQVSTDVLSVRVGTAVNYARYVEFGTRYMAARPYLRPALGAAFG